MYSILVVDDEPMLRDLISKILAMKGHQCDHAPDGEEALQKVHAKKYDALIVDVVMPKMDGLTLLKRIRQENQDLPVMIMTGFSRLSYMKQPIDEEAIRAGANDFISKPFSPSEFSARFHKMMATQEVLSQMKARQQEIERRSSEMIAAIQKESMDRIETIKKGFTEGGGTEAPPREGNGLPEGPLKPRAAAVSSEPVKPPCPIREKSEQETFKLGEYTRSVQKRIASYWTQPATWRPEWSTLEVEITVIIRRDGKIQEIRFDKRSINSNYDDLCMATLRKAEPFPPFPPELRDESIEIEITFQKAR